MDTTTTSEPGGTTITSQQQQQIRRTTLDGCWILDKTRENWSMNEYLQIMNVDPLAIEAHEKGEKEHDTFHTIEFVSSSTSSSSTSNRNLLLEPYDRIKIIKRSRVNNDVIVDLIIGQEYQQILQSNDRLKSSIATTNHLGTYLCIQSSLVTTDNHGTAIVTDIKRLVEPDDAIKDNNTATTSTEAAMNDNVMTDNTTNTNEQVEQIPPPPPPISTSMDDTDMMDE